MTASGAPAMRADVPLGEGESRERAARRARYGIKGALFVTGLAVGLYIGRIAMGGEFDFAAPWPPAAALGVAAIYLFALIAASLFISRRMDELERSRAYRAAAVAGNVYLLVYPTWFALWKGGFVAEPIHWALFILFWLSLALATLWYRFR